MVKEELSREEELKLNSIPSKKNNTSKRVELEKHVLIVL
jgi:hypothetical protein